MKPLTKKQQAVYEYLVECSEQSRVPSVREICKDVGLKSTSTAHLYLKALEEHGLIERDAGLNRCIRVVGEVSAKSVPVLGKVAAGNPIVAIEDVECYIPVDKSVSRGKDLFALRVQGESMLDAGILPDDILVVERTPVAENGEIVVALVDDSATVKTFYKEDGHFRLQPENESYEPIIVDEVVILGKVISLMRNY
ncbi:MAG: transcriptional repressor LexA [Ruminococcus sp.]|jgi:repressor LexA|nr:transcriptional repressor LexA [Ruminococcus sp.]